MLSPATSWAIKFDIWETGMSINEVVSLARQRDIAIARDDIIHGSKKFDPKLIDDKFYKASSLYYGTVISGRNSLVYLRLTDDSKFVSEIEVKVFGISDREIFTKEMLKLLSEKYGPFKERKDLKFRPYEWRPDTFSQVLMRVFSQEATITYTDLRIKALMEKQRADKEKKAIKGDSSKF